MQRPAGSVDPDRAIHPTTRVPGQQMSSNPVILFPGDANWHIGAMGVEGPVLRAVVVPEPAGADDEDAERGAARAVGAGLREMGYGGEPLVLALPSHWCLCAPVDTARLPAKQRHRALTYRLEEKLPFAAEDVVADFVDGPAVDGEDRQNAVLGVCVQKRPLATLVDALESNGIAIGAICPAALLALQHLAESPGSSELVDGAHAIVWQSANGDQLELFIRRAGRLCGWYILPNEPKDLLLHLTVTLCDRERGDEARHPIVAIQLGPDATSLLGRQPALSVVESEAPSPAVAATSMASAVIAGRSAPWVDLRREDLAQRDPLRQVRRPVRFALVAAALCLLCAGGGMLWRATRYDRAARRDLDAEEAMFRQVFPGGALPLDVRSRLASEERSLRGSNGDAASAPPSQATELLTLRELMIHLPADGDLRYRLLEIRLDEERFTLEGQAPRHGDADSIATALRQGGAFTVEPPRTEQMASTAAASAAASDSAPSGTAGVAFTITGHVAAAAAPAPGARREGR